MLFFSKITYLNTAEHNNLGFSMVSSHKYNVALVGATGLVGRELLKLLEDFPIKKLKCFASEKSKGKELDFKKSKILVDTLDEKSFEDIDIAFFAAGSKLSKQFLPFAKTSNCLVIDLSSAFRMEENVPLVIPEINPHAINKKTRLIASPNCTTTIMLMALFPLHRKFKIKRIVASTYQAASGGGIKLMNKLEKDTFDILVDKKELAYPYGFNLYLHDSALKENRYCEEEIKMLLETQKILEDKNIKVTATCVRVPILRAHSISMNVEFEKDISLKEAYYLLKKSPNLTIFEDFEKNRFATPFDATKKKETFVSRLRLDPTQKNTIELWAVGDQLLKGAALNGYQIAKYYISL